MRTIAVISKPQKPDLAPILNELVTWIRGRGMEPILDPVSGSYVDSARIVPRHEMTMENPELAIVLGGDGTLLAAARVFAKSKVPILSVNLGSLGFLTEVRLSELFSNLEGWSCGECHLDTRAMLQYAGITGLKVIDLRDGTTASPVLPSGSQIAASSRIWPKPRIASSSTSTSVPNGAERISSGSPISVL